MTCNTTYPHWSLHTLHLSVVNFHGIPHKYATKYNVSTKPNTTTNLIPTPIIGEDVNKNSNWQKYKVIELLRNTIGQFLEKVIAMFP